MWCRTLETWTQNSETKVKENYNAIHPKPSQIRLRHLVLTATENLPHFLKFKYFFSYISKKKVVVEKVRHSGSYGIKFLILQFSSAAMGGGRESFQTPSRIEFVIKP
jgi:hypothetical protein